MSSLSSSRAQWSIIIICAAVLALLFGLWVSYNLNNDKEHKTELASATMFDHPRNLTAFKLIDDHKKPFSIDQLKGHWNLVFFGFTNCPDLCPTTLSTLNQAYNALDAQNPAAMPQIVFISVDPQRDDPDHIKEYLSSFNPHFLGATGSEDQLKQLTQELSVLYAKVFQPDSKNYTIDHSGTILIINPQGQFTGVFTLPHDANKIAQDMKTIIATGLRSDAEPQAS